MPIRMRHARPRGSTGAPTLSWNCAGLLSLFAASAGAAASAGTPPATCGPITLAPSSLARPFHALDYAASLSAGGGLAPYTFAVTAGALPDGLVLAADGVLTGVASTPGASSFTITATDGDGCTGSASFLVPVSKGFRAPDAEVESSIPAAGTGGSGNPLLDTTSSSLVVGGIDPAVAVVGLEVHVTLRHERAGDLTLTLVAPDGARSVLADRRGGAGADYLGTVFADRADDHVCDGAAPFAGSYRPERPLGGRPANGTWTLEIEDAAAGNVGVLLDWSLDVDTASAGLPRSFHAEPFLWSRTFAASVNQAASDATQLYVTTGDSVMRVSKANPHDASNWVRSFLGGAPGGPLLVRGSSGSDVLVVNTNGFAYGLDPADGSTRWSANLRRVSCSTDLLAPAAECQIRSRSDCTFRAAVPSDLVFLGTRFGCGTITANKVFALDPDTGGVRWTFNHTGTSQVDATTGLVADAAHNRLYVVTQKTDPARSQNTIWALDTKDGSRDWGRDQGEIRARPVVSADGVFVLSASGELAKLDPSSGAELWSLTLANGVRFERDMAFDPTRGLLFAVDTSGELHAIEDLSTSASRLWSLATVAELREVAVTPANGWVYASSLFGRVYQIAELTGSIDRHQQVGTFQLGGAPRLVVERTLADGFVEARLTLVRDTWLERARLPWYPQDFAGYLGFDIEVPPYVELDVEGGTSPQALLLGELVTDTLTVSNAANRAPADVVLRATVPPKTSLVAATVPGGTATLAGDQLVVRLGRIEIGESVEVALTLRPGRADSFGRTYFVDCELPAPVGPAPFVTLVNQVTRAQRRHP